ncbi:hypothetical protein E8E14_000752 [Neopestalotiopsis sp. 37M]|nr:hypothetical protein E8E14_000752 [Neopestalotiopsis sp. 37M]
MSSYNQSANYTQSCGSYSYGHSHAAPANEGVYSSRSSSSKKRNGGLGGATVVLRWICPSCTSGSNNSWDYDFSCPFCFKPRPAAPDTFYGSP